MPQFVTVASWNRWTGSKDDITRLASEALAVIAVWPSEASETQVYCSFQVELRSGLTMSLSTVDELRELHQQDWLALRSLTINIHSDPLDLREAGYLVPRFSLRVSHSYPAITLRVEGQDRTRVEGLAHRAAEIINGSMGWPRWYSPSQHSLIPIAIVAVLGFAIIIAVLNLRVVRQSESLNTAVIIVGVLGTLAMGLVTISLFPTLELLTPGEPTRFQRFGSLIWGFLIATVAAVVGIPIAKYLGWA